MDDDRKTPARSLRGRGVHSAKRTPSSRFIAARGALDIDMAAMASRSSNSDESKTDDQFENQMNQVLLGPEAGNPKAKILSFSQKPPKPDRAVGAGDSVRAIFSKNRAPLDLPKKFRHVAATPERVLDAPGLVDDFYLNVLDWSLKGQLAIGLAQSVYLWNASDGSIALLADDTDVDNSVTSVSFMGSGSHLGIGRLDGSLELWDVERQQKMRGLNSHGGRIACLSWNDHILTSGSRDSQIHNHDVRIQNHHVSSFNYHAQEVCGLRWSPDGSQLASGGNDNAICIWELSSTSPKHVLMGHEAAIKAMAWSPHQSNLLATGGGTADRHIRFWNTLTGASLGAVDTKSQVCNLIWNPFEHEILSTHGFSQNQLSIWKYPSMATVAELTGHTSRVLHASLSSDGTTVVSAAADETLRFWKVFQPLPKKKSTRKPNHKGSKLRNTKIR